MVSSVLIDGNSEIAALSREFVCMKFCETDDREDYYRAAGYFLPQWYWQPILAFTFPDGTEINPHFRHTHEAISPAEVVRIMREVLKTAGAGLSSEAAAGLRKTVDNASEAVAVGEYDRAAALIADVRKAAPKGRIRADADCLDREIAFQKACKPLLDKLQAMPNLDDGATAMLNALNLVMARGYAEAFELLVSSHAGQTPPGEAGDLLAKLSAVLDDAIELSRVFPGRYRFGPDIYHDLRAEIRIRLDSLEKLVLQYHALLGDGTVCKAFEEHGPVKAGAHLRSSALLPYLEAEAAGSVSDLRVEIVLAGKVLKSMHYKADPAAGRWWEKAEVRPLTFDTYRGSTWNGLGFPKTGITGVDATRESKASAAPSLEDPGHEKLVRIYEVLDARRFTREAAAATYRITALGTGIVRYAAPLASRDGAVTTSQLIPVLSRIPHPKAAAQLFHVLGADDVTLRYHVPSELSWMEAQDYADISELVRYLETDDARLRDLAVQALGMVSAKDGFKPVLAFFRDQKPESERARNSLAAIVKIAGRDFGLVADKPLSSQAEAVKAIHSWWNEGAGEAPRAVWHAQALEAAGTAARGALAPAVAKGDAEKASAVLPKILETAGAGAVRSALIIAKDLKAASLAPQVLEFFRKAAPRDPNLGLARNVLRDLMTVELLPKLIEILTDPDKGVTVLDLLLVVTGKHEFYPLAGYGRTGDSGAMRAEWAKWYEEEKGNIAWDPAERMFVAKK